MESRKNFVINTAFYGILIALALAFWQYLLPILMPFIIGFAIASVVQLPLHMIHLKGGRMQGGAAVALCIVLYGLLVWGMIFFSVKVIGEISNFAAAVPDLFYDYLYPVIWDVGDLIQGLLEPIDMTLAQLVNEVGKTVASTLAKYATEFSGWAVKALASGVVSIPGALLQIIIMVVSSFYIAADYQTVVNFLKSLIPAAHRDKVVEVIGYARKAIWVYIKSYTIMFFITTAELYAGFLLLDIPYKLGLAVGIAIFDLMPILGVGGILLPWGAIALILGNLKIGIGVIVLYIFICAMRYIIEPRFVGSQISVHPLATLVAMVVGLRLAGLVGMLVLPVALMAVTKVRANTAAGKERQIDHPDP
ncbi:MAG: AI-2E family transporter [Oscillospiraceae bacterium]|nr:AI-2E family transporter [Oscillospiraceae bacterium]